MSEQEKTELPCGEYGMGAPWYPLRTWWQSSRLFNQDVGLPPFLEPEEPRWMDVDRVQRSLSVCSWPGLAPLFVPYISGSMHYPGQKISKEQYKWRVSLDVAHFSPSEISLSVKEGFLEIGGKHEERPDEHGFIARCFTRKYRLPVEIDATRIVSMLSVDGILTVEAPLPETSVPAAIIIPIKVEVIEKNPDTDPDCCGPPEAPEIPPAEDHEEPSPPEASPPEETHPLGNPSGEVPSQGQEAPEPEASQEQEVPEPEVSQEQEISEPGVSQKQEIPEPGVSQEQEDPEPGVTQEQEIPEPGVTQEQEIPEPVVSQEQETLEPGIQEQEAPEPVVAQEQEIPEPGVTQEQEAPEPGVAQEQEIPEPVVAQEQEIPEPVVAQEQEISEPGVTQEQESPEPGVAQEQESPEPGVAQEEEIPELGVSQEQEISEYKE